MYLGPSGLLKCTERLLKGFYAACISRLFSPIVTCRAYASNQVLQFSFHLRCSSSKATEKFVVSFALGLPGISFHKEPKSLFCTGNPQKRRAP